MKVGAGDAGTGYTPLEQVLAGPGLIGRPILLAEDIALGIVAGILLHQGKLLLTEDIDQIRSKICKLQCVIQNPLREQELLRSLHVLKSERTGSVLTLTVRGERSEVMRIADAQEPLFIEVLPLTLEEIFISETEVAGYDIKDFFLH